MIQGSPQKENDCAAQVKSIECEMGCQWGANVLLGFESQISGDSSQITFCLEEKTLNISLLISGGV